MKSPKKQRIQVAKNKSPKKTWVKSPKKQRIQVAKNKSPSKHGWNHPKNNVSKLLKINPLKKTWVKSPKKQRIQVAKNKSPSKHGWNHPKNNVSKLLKINPLQNMDEITQKTTKTITFFVTKSTTSPVRTQGIRANRPPRIHPPVPDLYFLQLRSVVYSKLQGLGFLGGMIIWVFVARLVNLEKNLPGYVCIYIYILVNLGKNLYLYTCFFFGAGGGSVKIPGRYTAIEK